MLLNCATFGAMFRPLKPTRIKVKPSSQDNGTNEAKTTLMAQGLSMGSLHAGQPHRSRFFGTNNNMEYPTAAQVIGSSPDIIKYDVIVAT